MKTLIKAAALMAVAHQVSAKAFQVSKIRLPKLN
jgi:hypothetical protein